MRGVYNATFPYQFLKFKPIIEIYSNQLKSNRYIKTVLSVISYTQSQASILLEQSSGLWFSDSEAYRMVRPYLSFTSSFQGHISRIVLGNRLDLYT
jgi:hypothetical protein